MRAVRLATCQAVAGHGQVLVAEGRHKQSVHAARVALDCDQPLTHYFTRACLGGIVVLFGVRGVLLHHMRSAALLPLITFPRTLLQQMVDRTLVRALPRFDARNHNRTGAGDPSHQCRLGPAFAAVRRLEPQTQRSGGNEVWGNGGAVNDIAHTHVVGARNHTVRQRFRAGR